MISKDTKNKLKQFNQSKFSTNDKFRALPRYLNDLLIDLYIGKHRALSKNSEEYPMQLILLRLNIIKITGKVNLILTKQGYALCKDTFYPKAKLKELVHKSQKFSKCLYSIAKSIMIIGACCILPLGIIWGILFKLQLFQESFSIINGIESVLSIIFITLIFLCIPILFLGKQPIDNKINSFAHNTVWTTNMFNNIDKYCTKNSKQEKYHLIEWLRQFPVDDYCY